MRVAGFAITNILVILIAFLFILVMYFVLLVSLVVRVWSGSVQMTAKKDRFEIAALYLDKINKIKAPS